MTEVKICDVTLRDGMQAVNRDAVIPLDLRLRLLDALRDAGLPYLEVGSFVSRKYVPSMADTADLLAAMPHLDAEVAVLVPNLRYYRVLEESDHEKVDTIALFVSSSEAYSTANTKMTKERAFAAAAEVASAACPDGFRLRGYLSCAFRELDGSGEPMDPDIVLRDGETLLAMGCSTVVLSDTDGRASPRDMERTIRRLGGSLGLEPLGVHLHDRYGQGLANALAAYELGVRSFDSSIGGVGGSRSIRSSVGNIATEELVALFEGMGVDTGVDQDALILGGGLVIEMTERAGDPVPPSKVLANQLVPYPSPAALAAGAGSAGSDTVERTAAVAPAARRESVPADRHEGPEAGTPLSLMATMVAVPTTFVAISWVLSLFSLHTKNYGEFIAFGGSMMAFAFGVAVATFLSRFTDLRHIALADLPREAHRLFDDLVREVTRRLDLRG